MHPSDNRPPTLPYGVIRSCDSRLEEGRAGLFFTFRRLDDYTEIVKKALTRRTAKLALPLLASGAIELPARLLDAPPHRVRGRTQKK